jgi:hypothetical protein
MTQDENYFMFGIVPEPVPAAGSLKKFHAERPVCCQYNIIMYVPHFP